MNRTLRHSDKITTVEIGVPICGGPLDGGSHRLTTSPERELRTRPVVFLDGITAETISNPQELRPGHLAYGYRLVRRGNEWRYRFSGVEATPQKQPIQWISGVALVMATGMLVTVCLVVLPSVFAGSFLSVRSADWMTVAWACGVPSLIGGICAALASRRRALSSSG